MNRSSRIVLAQAAVMAAFLLLPASGTARKHGSIPGPDKHLKTCEDIKIIPYGMTDISETSPDGRYTVCVKEDREDKEGLYTYTSVYLSYRGRMRILGRYKDMTETSDLLWAPDSRAFAWNFTYGGASNGWTAWVFDLRSGRFSVIERMATRDYHRRLRQACKKDEADDNVDLVKWVGNRSLLIAVQAHPFAGDCRDPSPTDYYQVALPSGRIIKRLQKPEQATDEKEFHSRSDRNK